MQLLPLTARPVPVASPHGPQASPRIPWRLYHVINIILALLGLFPAGAVQCSAGASNPKTNTILFIRASQAGYEPSDLKTAIAFSPSPLPGSFAVVETGTGKVHYQGKSKPCAAQRWGKFEHHAEWTSALCRRQADTA